MNIGAAAKASGVSRRMIRYYEKIGLIPVPPRRDSGYRDCTAADVHRLRFVANAHDLGFPIENIRNLLELRSNGQRTSAQVKAIAIARAEELGRNAGSLQALRRAPLELAERCHGDERPDCPIIERMSGEADAPAESK